MTTVMTRPAGRAPPPHAHDRARGREQTLSRDHARDKTEGLGLVYGASPA
jgi:hypothetical protein